MRHLSSLLPSALAAAVLAGPAAAQGTNQPHRTERVSYRNPQDSAYLSAVLTLPTGRGPFAGVVLLSIAGVDPLVSHLAARGLAVLVPERRGFVEVEPLLRATYQDLAEDAQAALDYLRARPEVDDDLLGLIGQGDDAPAAMLAAAASPTPVPLALLAPPAFPGTEVFLLEQHGLAERQRWRPQALEALDSYVAEIAATVLDERTPYLREYRLERLIASSEIQLPYNAAFPSGADQPHFFSSPLWHDRLAFEPEEVLARLHGPVLALLGAEDLDMPRARYLAALRRGLSAAPTRDATVCLMPERVRHSFSAELVEFLGEWLGERIHGAVGSRPNPCVEEETRNGLAPASSSAQLARGRPPA